MNIIVKDRNQLAPLPDPPFLPHHLLSPLLQPLCKFLILRRTALPSWLPTPLEDFEIRAALLRLHILTRRTEQTGPRPLVGRAYQSKHAQDRENILHARSRLYHRRGEVRLNHTWMHGRNPDLALPVPRTGRSGAYVLCRVLVCRMLASLLCPYRGHGPLSLSDRSSKLMPPLGAIKWPDEVMLTMRTLPGGSVLAVCSIRGSRCSVKTQCAR